MFNFGLSSESGRTSESQSGFSRNSFSRGSFDTLESLRTLESRINDFNLDEVTTSANTRAATDTSAAVSNIFRQYQETALPEIFGAQGSTGAYGSTTGQLLAGDAFARATNQSAELQLGVASSYIGQSLSARDQLITQFSQLLQANLASSGSDRTFNVGSGSSKTTGRRSTAGLSMGGGTGAGTFTGQ